MHRYLILISNFLYSFKFKFSIPHLKHHQYKFSLNFLGLKYIMTPNYITFSSNLMLSSINKLNDFYTYES